MSGTNQEIEGSTTVQSVTGPNVDNTDPNNPIVNPLGLIKIVDLNGEFFTDLATATAYIEQFITPAVITDKSFNEGIFFFTVPHLTMVSGYFLIDNITPSITFASLIDRFGLLDLTNAQEFGYMNAGHHILGNGLFQNSAFNLFSGTIEMNSLYIAASGGNFGQSSTGKFIIEGNLGSTETANFGATFFSGSTATIFANASKYTSNAGGIHGDLQTAIANGCNVQFDGINLEEVSNKSTSIVADQASNTKYPSVKSVFDWITANYQPKKFSYTDDSNGITSVSNSNTLSKSVLIPANTLTNGSLNIKGRSQKSGTGSYAWLVIYVNTTNSLSGASEIGRINNASNNTILNFSIDRTIPIKVGSFTAFIINAITGYEEAITNNVSTVTIDWTVDQYIILAVQANGGASPGESIVANFLSVNQF